MNDLQKKQMDFAIAQYDRDSTPALATCHNDCKYYSWFQMKLMTIEVTGDKEVAEAVRDMQCLN